MSYLLFSQTSSANGTRDQWNTGSGTAGTIAGNTSANGKLLADLAGAAFEEATAFGTGYTPATYAANHAQVQAGVKALYDLSALDENSTGNSAVSGAFASALADSGNVLGASAAYKVDGSQSNRTLDDRSGYSVVNGHQTLDIGMAELNWNDIKNVETVISSAETGTGVDHLILRNFVDVRVSIGDTAGCHEANERGVFEVDIENAKRGQVDGSESDMALDVAIDVWTNDSGWSNSFNNLGSVFADVFTINHGALQGNGEFKAGAGALYKGPTVAATGTDLTIQAGDSVYNGQLTTLLTNLGAGNDFYSAVNGATVINCGNGLNLDAELMTRDWVWGGSGNDTILAGGNADVLFGDFGGRDGIAQLSDPSVAMFHLGGSGDPASWVTGTGASLYYKTWQDTGFKTFTAADVGDLTKTAELDPTRYLKGAALASEWIDTGPDVPGIRSTIDAAEFAWGLGVDTATRGRTNGADATNPEINSNQPGANGTTTGSDVLGVRLGITASAAKVTLTHFYGAESNGAELAVITLKKDGVVVGTAEVAAREDWGVGGVKATTGGVHATVDAFAHVDPSGENNVVDADNRLDASATTTGRYTANNPGVVEVSVGGVDFDSIEISSNGNWTWTAGQGWRANPNSTDDVSDLFLRDICYTVAANDGADLLDGGTGADTLEGGGDFGHFALTGNVLTVNDGTDRLFLGADCDADIVVYREGDGVDVISQFDVVRDRIQLDVATDAEWQKKAVLFEGVASTLLFDSNTPDAGLIVKGATDLVFGHDVVFI